MGGALKAVIPFPDINPNIIEIGPFKLRWYGLMYVLGFVGGWILARRRAQNSWSIIKLQQVDDLIFYCMLGVILGGRLGYVIFYGWAYWLQDPLYVFKITQGGMSFPFLSLTREYGIVPTGQVRTRVQAFLEKLEIARVRRGARGEGP